MDVKGNNNKKEKSKSRMERKKIKALGWKLMACGGKVDVKEKERQREIKKDEMKERRLKHRDRN